jgi:hypothetical protein
MTVIAARRSHEPSFDLAPRTATLGGVVPVRAARACPPFLSGNAFGWFFRPRQPIRVARSLRGATADQAGARIRVTSSSLVELTLDTGLTLSPPDGVRLVLERPRNLRDRRVDVEPIALEPGRPSALTLRLTLRRGETVTLSGNVAAVAPWPDQAPPFRIVDPVAGAALVRAHAAFFDASYFDVKQRSPTQRYKRLAREGPPLTAAPAGIASVVHLGGAPPRVIVGPDGLPALAIAADLDAALAFHGRVVEPRLDAAALRAREAPIQRAMRDALGAEPPASAVRYFTTWITTHAPGDPHAFFKPATLVATEPGWALVVDGPDAAGLEGLRGITDPSWFHALPAVVEIVGTEGRVRRGATIVTARLTSQALLDASLAWH